MPVVRRSLSCLFGTMVLFGIRLGAQEEIVTLQNGAMFRGRLVHECERFLDLEVANGRIRLSKRWIEERRPGLSDAGAASAPSARTPQRPGDHAPEPRALSAELRSGAVLLRPLHRRFEDFTIGASAADVTVGFWKLVQEGRGAEAVEQLVDAEALLSRAFPLHTKGLTAYSRRMAARLMSRWLARALTQPLLTAGLQDCKFTARALPGPPGIDFVEIQIHRGAPEPVTGEIGVARGRIVDLAAGPPPCGDAIRTVLEGLRAAGDKSHSLVPVLESLVMRSRTGGAPAAADPDPAGDGARRAWSIRPHEKGYTVTLPWSFEPVRDESGGPQPDVFVHATDGPCAAMVLTEDLVIPLDEIRKHFLENVARVAADAEVSGAEPAEIDGVPAQRLRLSARIGDAHLSFDVILMVADGRSFQAAAWCPAGRRPDAQELMNALFAGFSLTP